MKEIVVKSLWLLLAVLALPVPARAAGYYWTEPAQITLVCRNGSTPDTAAGRFTVHLRDLLHNPVVGVRVTVDFSLEPGVRLATDQLNGATLTDCGSHSVRRTSDANGSATFAIMGAGSGRLGTPASPQARLYNEGTYLGSVPVRILDLDGGDGMSANDLSLWLTDAGTGEYFGRGDYDNSGHVGANDLSVWLDAFGAQGSIQGCPAYCP